MNTNFLRSIVYGGTDGIITMFNIVSGVKGANLPYYIVFFLGVASLIGDALSMGFSDFLSIKADQDYKNYLNKNNKTENEDPKINGIITFLSFIIFGSLPLTTYLLSSKFSKNNYINTFISTTIALFVLGSVQSYFTKKKWYKTGASVTMYGILASFMSYSVAKIVSSYSPIKLS